VKWRKINVSWKDVCWLDVAAALVCLGLELFVVYVLATAAPLR